MTTLSQALQTCDMLLIDGLHAFDFVHDENGLRVECMDGRELKRWSFSAEQIANALVEGEDWRVIGESGEHRLVCMSAFSVSSEEDDDESAAENPDR